jgi:hypothetical protein
VVKSSSRGARIDPNSKIFENDIHDDVDVNTSLHHPHQKQLFCWATHICPSHILVLVLPVMLLRLMIALVSSTTAARAFRPLFAPVRSSTLMRMSSSLTGKTCVSVEESIDAHGSGSKFVDGSWFLKGRDGREEFEVGPRIEGAEYFDINDISAKGADLNPKGLPHMMPPKELFAAAMDAMGISNEDHIVLYGGKGCVRYLLLLKPMCSSKMFIDSVLTLILYTLYLYS